jgi:hypothetical protein
MRALRAAVRGGTAADVGVATDSVNRPMPFGRQLAAAATRLNVTPSVVVQTALVLALSRSSVPGLVESRDRVVFGMYAANRAPGEERGAGRYTNMLPVTVELVRGETVRALLERMRRRLRDLLALESADFDALAPALSFASARQLDRVQFADDGYPSFLAEATDEEKIFDLLTSRFRLGTWLSIVSMLRPPFMLVLTYDRVKMTSLQARELHSDILGIASSIVEARGDESIDELLAGLRPATPAGASARA